MLNRRHRRGYYPTAQSSPMTSMLGRTVVLLLLGLVLFILGAKVLRFFGVGNAVRQNAVVLTIEGQGTVNVAIEGNPMKRAENDLKLYPDDRVETSGRAYSVLSFFDGTDVRLDERSEVAIIESVKGDESSKLALEIAKGNIWLATPKLETFSGSIVRQIQTPNLKLVIPSRTEAVVSSTSIVVFAADGLGVQVWLTGRDEPILIGEGQQLSVPDQTVITGDPYRYRKPLDPLVMRPMFVEESRASHARRSAEVLATELTEPVVPIDEILLVTEPQDDAQVQSSTIRVAGSVGTDVTSVRINGYIVAIDEAQSTFAQDIALPDSDEVSIVVEALAADGTVAEEIRRTIHRDREPPAPPVITAPAEAGATYRTASNTLEIRGKATKDIVGIEVNDYRLQLFSPGDDSWTYLADVKLGNFQAGENVYSVVAINKGGYRSEPAVLTIILGEGEEGVVDTGEKPTGGDSAPEEGMPEDAETSDALPENAPLMPGSLTVTGPTPGTSHTATGTSLLIEGTVPASTNSVWVNDYQLQLYEPGKTFWNYIADTKLFTMRRGTNVYHVVARNADGEILDEMEYTVVLDPQNIAE